MIYDYGHVIALYNIIQRPVPRRRQATLCWLASPVSHARRTPKGYKTSPVAGPLVGSSFWWIKRSRMSHIKACLAHF